MTIVPPPPHAAGVGLPWDVEVDDAVAVLAAARREHGDTFTVASGDGTYLFVFSPEGVTGFYDLPEDVASKGVADYLMLKRKLPDELFAGRRTLPHELFTRDGVAGYLGNLDEVLVDTVAELGAAGRVDLFGLGRRIDGLPRWWSGRSRPTTSRTPNSAWLRYRSCGTGCSVCSTASCRGSSSRSSEQGRAVEAPVPDVAGERGGSHVPPMRPPTKRIGLSPWPPAQ